MRASFCKHRGAATSIEYGMLAAVIAIGLMFGAGKLRDLVSGSLEQLAGGGDAMKVESCPPGDACNARPQDRPGADAPPQPLGLGVR